MGLLGSCGFTRVPTGAPVVVYMAQRIRTLDPQRPLAEALAVQDGKLLAVGGREEVLRRAGPGAVVEPLGDVTVVPGFEDAHGHLAGLGQSLAAVSLEGATSQEEAVTRAVHAPKTSYQGDWLVGFGWDQNRWVKGRGAFPTRVSLDAAFPSTPVLLIRADGHAIWVNSVALRRMGIGAQTKEPSGGRILRDAEGQPTGVLVDAAAALIQSRMPPATEEQLEDWLDRAFQRCAAAGVTVVHDAGTELPVFRALLNRDAKGRLPLRVYAMAWGAEKSDAYLSQGLVHGHHLDLRAVKFVMDGSLGSRGAALEEPYSDDPTNRGYLLLSQEELERRARPFVAKGFQVAVHAIGDRANRQLLEVYARLQSEFPSSVRNRVEHAQVLREQDIPRLGKLGLIASMQPKHATSDMAWAKERLGEARLKGSYAWRSVADAGAVLAFGSDFPVESPDVLMGLYAARTREDAQGKPKEGWYPSQRLEAPAALAAFTQGAAYASFAEGRRGTLAPGMDADFTVLSVDPVGEPPEALLTGKVLRTVVDGQTVFQAGR